MKTQEIIFGIYQKDSNDAKAIIENGKLKSLKLLIKVPRRFYYSFLNDMNKAFDEQYPMYL